LPLYLFKKESVESLEIEADDIESARIKAVDASDYEWKSDDDPYIDDGITLSHDGGSNE
jgi:hypothetical protein